MEISDISKMASRKRLNTDAEKLREKVSRETAKIIKLKVAQDTAYWDVKERLQQLAGAHERLQRNMLDVQMQHEAASARCQRELLLRPDTLNRVCGTRAVCDALEEFGERARRTLERARADQRALGAAYAQCAARARDALRDQRASAEAARAQCGAEAQRLARALDELGAARARGDMLEDARADLAQRLDRADAELRQREQEARETGARAERLAARLDAQHDELRRTVAALELQAQEARAQAEAEREATRASDECAAQLRAEASAARDQLRVHREEADATIAELRAELSSLRDRTRDLDATICNRDQRVAELEAELVRAGERAAALERELAQQTAAAERRAAEHDARLYELQGAADAQRAADAARAEELTRRVGERDAELDEKARTIAKLMDELKAAAGALEAARRQHEGERRAAAAAAERLEALVRDKDAALDAHVRTVLDARAEGERLQQRIATMQGTIDNIQKELTGRAPPPAPAHRAERDEGPDADLLYGFLSDGSTDGDALDKREVKRRFEALARGAVRPGILPLSQVKKELQKKSRAFFKNKRADNKLNKKLE